MSKESIYKQNITGDVSRDGTVEDFDKLCDNQMGFSWDPKMMLGDVAHDPGRQLAGALL